MKANDFSINDIKVGDKASFTRKWTDEDVQIFSNLSGDNNPLHLDDEYAASTSFKKRLVHGMLVGSLFSTLVGMYIPGKRCLYVDQKISFKKPVFIGDTVEASSVVLAKSESTGVLTISMKIKCNDEVVVLGEAHVKVI